MNAPARSLTCDMFYYGVYSAIVEEVGSDKHPGEVRLSFPWFDPGMKTEWCRVCNPYAGNGYGFFFHPEKDDEVLVAFIQGDMRWPIVLGGLYNGQDKPSSPRTASKDEKLIRTKAGHQIVLDDTKGSEKIVILDKTGNNKIVIDATDNSIAITATGKLTISAKGIELKSDAGIEMKSTAAFEVKSDAGIELKANAGVDVTASATMNLKGATINLN